MPLKYLLLLSKLLALVEVYNCDHQKPEPKPDVISQKQDWRISAKHNPQIDAASKKSKGNYAGEDYQAGGEPLLVQEFLTTKCVVSHLKFGQRYETVESGNDLSY
jgi:hypothetical protein